MFRPGGSSTHSFPDRQYYCGRDLTRAQSIADLRAMALNRLPRVNAEYLEGGAEDERSLWANRQAFDELEFQSRVLRDVSHISLQRTILGVTSSLPLAIAPTGFNGLLWHRGDLALARAASSKGIAFAQSTVSNATIADVAVTPGLRHWFQLYLYGEDCVWERLLQQAAAAGCETVILTVDSPVHGNREWDRRNYQSGFALTFSSKLDMLCHTRWMWQVFRHGLPSFANLAQFTPGPDRTLYSVARWALANQRPQMDWATVAQIRRAWPGKLLIKGVTNVADVRVAMDAGLDGVVLSNHGGRQLDRSVVPLRLVRQARAAVKSGFALLVDSGFRRGSDIVQALALGADAVLLGRAMLYGLAAGGEAGVRRAIDILATEISRTVALLGLRSVDELSPEVFA